MKHVIQKALAILVIVGFAVFTGCETAHVQDQSESQGSQTCRLRFDLSEQSELNVYENVAGAAETITLPEIMHEWIETHGCSVPEGAADFETSFVLDVKDAQTGQSILVEPIVSSSSTVSARLISNYGNVEFSRNAAYVFEFRKRILVNIDGEYILLQSPKFRVSYRSADYCRSYVVAAYYGIYNDASSTGFSISLWASRGTSECRGHDVVVNGSYNAIQFQTEWSLSEQLSTGGERLVGTFNETQATFSRYIRLTRGRYVIRMTSGGSIPSLPMIPLQRTTMEPYYFEVP